MASMPQRATIKRYVPKSALRLRTLQRYGAFRRTPRLAMDYLIHGRELDNFTYDIANRDELATFVAHWCGTTEATALSAIAELDDDHEFQGDLRQRLRSRPDREPDLAFGRRLGWYAVTRIRKPELVVETGVHDGLGSAVFLRALERNGTEGNPGTLLSFDIRPDVGWLIPERLRSRHELVIGNAVESLRGAVDERVISLFLHDSDHHYQHESAELEAAYDLGAEGTIIMSDNAHSGQAMIDFCNRHQLAFGLFLERPINHFYAGAGIGITLRPSASGQSEVSAD